MLNVRVIPCLLLREGGLVKTTRFAAPKYIGDPINAVKIFNDKEVDELLFLDISATPGGRAPNFDLVQDIAAEAFMPFGYGGGVSSLDHIKRLVGLGAEKVVLNAAAVSTPALISQAAATIGSQSIVVAIDVKQRLFGRYEVVTHSATRKTGLDPVEWAQKAADAGAGEIVVNSVDRDGCMNGYDVKLLSRVADAVNVPVVACGGAGCLADFREAVVSGGAAAVAAGSMFVLHGKHRAVLITYPSRDELEGLFDAGNHSVESLT